jgi:amino acid transporter/mannitol/fructose-specific phosphotransferase system IIA component (Ntr-type)
MSLKKELSFIHVFSIAAGAMISSGIFVLPGLAYTKAGPSLFLAYFVAGFLALLGVLSVIELATAMPRAGGDYYFINRSLGPMAGTISGLFGWVAISLKSAFAIFGMSEVLFLITGSPLLINSIILTSGFVILNIAGVKEAARLEVILVLGLLGIMAAYTISGIGLVDESRFSPFLPYGTNSLFATAGFVFVSFGGLISVASVAEEVKNPKRNIPLGLITAVVAVTLLYFILLFVTVGVLPASMLAGSFTPLADTARTFWGTPGYIIITVAAVLAFVTTAVAGIMSASRYPMALSRDNLLPRWLGAVHPRTHTPVASLLLTGVFIATALLLPLDLLVKAASTVILSANIMANVAVIILRESKLRNYQPSFKAPWYPWLQIITIVLLGFFVVDMGLQTVEISVGFFLVALLIYVAYGRRHATQEYALLHVVARLTNRRIATSSLEVELREILHQRDEVVHDEFDKAVLAGSVLDASCATTRDAFFAQVAQEMSHRVSLDEAQILQLLNEREAEGSTAFSPFIAVPHIIMPGEGEFHLLLARCHTGIAFSDEAPEVKAVFVIFGTADTRHLHLKALAAIAQIVRSSSFKERWMQADSPQHLQDLLLLSPRKR